MCACARVCVEGVPGVCMKSPLDILGMTAWVEVLLYTYRTVCGRVHSYLS